MSLIHHWTSSHPRNTVVTAPAIEITGTPPRRIRPMGEFWNMLGFSQGRMVAAIDVPRNVTAMTSVASRVRVRKFELYAYTALTMIDGISIRAMAPYGTWRFSDTFPAHSGRTRSNAAAKITLVEDRNRVPDHPMNHRLITSI